MSLTNNPLVNYIKESFIELKKVVWPTRKVVLRDTAIVVSVSLALAIFFGAVDFGLSEGLKALLSL